MAFGRRLVLQRRIKFRLWLVGACFLPFLWPAIERLVHREGDLTLALVVAAAAACFGVMIGAFTVLPDYLELRKMPSELKTASDGVRRALCGCNPGMMAVAASHVEDAIELGAFEGNVANTFRALSAGGLTWPEDPTNRTAPPGFHAFMNLARETGFRRFPLLPDEQKRVKYYSDAIRHVAQQIDDFASSLE